MNQAGRLGMMRRARLPYKKRVEYLESTGRQWIDTGLPYHSTMSMKGRFTRLNTQGGSVVILATTITPPLIYFSAMQGVKLVDRFVWRRPKYAEQLYAYSFSVPYTKDFEYDYDNDVLKVDGVAVKSGIVSAMGGKTSPYYSDSNMYMFGIAGSYCSSGRIFYLKIWDNGVLVRDFIPVLFTSELGQSEGAMFDRANPTVGMNPDGSARTDGLYRNRGTGAFVIGPDIQKGTP